jgi:two-component system sensor histidine kinase KdpD
VWKRVALRYLAALSTVAAATALALPLYAGAPAFPALLLLGAVAISAAYGGYGPAVVSILGGFLALDYFFEYPLYSLELTSPSTSLYLLAFALVGVLIGTLNARLLYARRRAWAAHAQAEAAVNARDEALATVSHDLRTPLTAIKTSVSTLRNPGTPLPEATRFDLLGTIEAEADRLVHFVSDALAMTRLEAGIAPDRQWNAVGEIVSAVLDRCGPVLGDRPVTFDVPDTLPLARFDAGLLEQALTNLLENVGVHTPPGTRVAILGRIEAGFVHVEVSDGGPGIPAAARERVFSKFERLRDSGFGTGLGLAIARAATEAQGGEVRVDDSPLGGVRFIILVPNVITAEQADAR